MTASSFFDAYEVLGVAPDASQAELKTAHRCLAQRHHPDRAPPEEQEAATRRLQRINIAYGLVRDEQSRARYDAVRRRWLAHHVRQGDLTGVDAALTRRWEQLLLAAGRWAGGRLHRTSLGELRADGASRWAGRRLGRLLR